MVTDQPSGATRARSALIPAAKAAVSIILLWILFSRVDVVRLWAVARHASVPWLVAALGLYLAMIVTSAWRWDLLLKAQGLVFPFARLVASFLVATFFNNFLPSNIGGDVIRISDTAPAAGSKTLATTVVLLDRGLGLLGLVLVAAMGASAGPGFARSTGGLGAGMLWAGFGLAAMIATPALLMPNGLAALLKPLRVFHPDWVDERIGRITAALARFRESPGALGGCFAGAVAVQGLLVGFYLAVAHSMSMPITFAALAVIVPISFIVQMVPISMNGFGVREATFGFYFGRLGLPLESGVLVSLMGAALMMVFSLSGAAAYVSRRAHHRSALPS
ncbi:MAG: lysylphosphatidylglycerol synthase transmembrane domain-containing protein [Acidobacteriota bacterium]